MFETTVQFLFSQENKSSNENMKCLHLKLVYLFHRLSLNNLKPILITITRSKRLNPVHQEGRNPFFKVHYFQTLTNDQTETTFDVSQN